MDKEAILKELDEVINDKDLDKTVKAELESVRADIEKVGTEKVSKLISTGMKVVCVNAIQGPIKGSDTPMTLYKGRYYVVTDADSYPGYVIVQELDGGTDIGIFEVNRFLPDTSAF
jgi:hypothetical protein